MDDDDDDNIDEDDDMGTMMSTSSDFKSKASRNVTARKSRRSSGKGEEKWCGTTSIGLPYVIDLWKNKPPPEYNWYSSVDDVRSTHVQRYTSSRFNG